MRAEEYDVGARFAERNLHEAALGSYRVELVHEDGTCNYWITKTAADALRSADGASWGMADTDLIYILVDTPDGPPVVWGPWGRPRGWRRVYGRVRYLGLGLSMWLRHPRRRFALWRRTHRFPRK